MPGSTRNPYLDRMNEEILEAGPLDLVVLLYRGLLASLREAQRCMAAGDLPGKARATGKAVEIVVELNAALDRQHGGALAGRLGPIYAYLLGRLQEASFRQQAEPLAEAEKVVAVLLEAWSAIQVNRMPPPLSQALPAQPVHFRG